MGPKRTYILSVHEPGDRLVLEDVRTRRRAHLNDLAEIGKQIESWHEQDPASASASRGVEEKQAP